MLRYPNRLKKWSGKAQSGFFIDFFCKKVADMFIRNVFIFAAIFFGEKYMIEKITKKIVDFFLFNTNKIIGLTSLSFSTFFILFLSLLFYFIIFINILFI